MSISLGDFPLFILLLFSACGGIANPILVKNYELEVGFITTDIEYVYLLFGVSARVYRLVSNAQHFEPTVTEVGFHYLIAEADLRAVEGYI